MIAQNILFFIEFVILIIAGTFTLQYLFEYVLLENKFSIKNRLIYTFFEFMLIFLSIIGGLYKSVFRMILLLVVQMFSFSRFDQSIMPGWLDQIIYLDPIYKIYLSMVYMHHTHNHYITLTFANYVMQSVGQN